MAGSSGAGVQDRERSKQDFQSINPATEQVISTFRRHTSGEIAQKIEQAETAWHDWRGQSVEDRAKFLTNLEQVLREEQEELSRLMVLEMGKPILQARAEIEKCQALCRYYQSNGPQALQPEVVTGNTARKSYVRFDPLGAVLAVMPWNYPFWQVFRFAVPATLAGNVGVLKHATNVLGCADAIESLFHKAGYPDGVFTSLHLDRDEIPRMLKLPFIRAATLTGSEQAGVALAQAAGKELKKCVLELGGSDPFIILKDADLQLAIEQAVAGRTANNGQTCIAAKRFLVDHSIFDEFVEGLTAGMKSLQIDDPMKESCQMGPLARKDLRESLHEQVTKSVSEGAKVTTGGKALDRTGWYYAATVLSEVSPQMTAFREETFGPVAAVTRVQSAEEAIAFANKSSFGLGASIWTRDIERAEKIAVKIDSGNVFINSIVKSDPTLPFGGTKKSGFGRELGIVGLHEFVNMKTVWIS